MTLLTRVEINNKSRQRKVAKNIYRIFIKTFQMFLNPCIPHLASYGLV